MLDWLCQTFAPRASPEKRYAPERDARVTQQQHMNEIVCQEMINRIQELSLSQKVEKDLNDKPLEPAPDYSWLADKKPGPQLSAAERFEVEQLCEQIEDEEWTRVVAHLRARMGRCNEAGQVLWVFRDVVSTAVQSRPRPNTFSQCVRGVLGWTPKANTVDAFKFENESDSSLTVIRII